MAPTDRWVNFASLQPTPGPRPGQILRGTGVWPVFGSLYLNFREFGSDSYPAGYFEKFEPSTFDFREQLQRPVRPAAPVRTPELVP